MNLLLVAATPYEIAPFLSACRVRDERVLVGQHSVRVLITGVGMVATAFAIGRELASGNYDLAINAGIAGCFDPQISLGEVLRVNSDTFAELGAEDGDDFLSIDQMGFGKSAFSPLPCQLPQALESLKVVSAITVNRVHGNQKSIDQTVARFNPQIESMEGAAFFYASNQMGLPSLQIRSVSNKVEVRNKAAWNIPLAIGNLNDCLIDLLNTI